MNYLQLVNSVLRRLRESEVTTVQGSGNNNSYARLIGDYINEAKQTVENAWQWMSLKQTINVNTVAGITEYTLFNAGHRFQLQYAYNDTSDNKLYEEPIEWWIEQNSLSSPPTGSVEVFSFSGLDTGSDNVKIQVSPVPSGVEALKFYGTVRTGNLIADTDTMLVPDRPVILLATAMAQEERGEDSGQQSVNSYRLAQSALADEISLDAARQPEKTMWYET